jgi:hypothetical protein
VDSTPELKVCRHGIWVVKFRHVFGGGVEIMFILSFENLDGYPIVSPISFGNVS